MKNFILRTLITGSIVFVITLLLSALIWDTLYFYAAISAGLIAGSIYAFVKDERDHQDKKVNELSESIKSIQDNSRKNSDCKCKNCGCKK